MEERHTFTPPRRAGVFVQSSAMAALLVLTAWGLWRATRASVGPVFLAYLLPLFAALVLMPLLAYRLYTLRNAHYQLSRDFIHLQWGWRSEKIPIEEVLWVRPVNDLEIPLRIPWLRWPGAVLGRSRLPDGRPVEFLAARTRGLLLIGTARGAFAISPDEPQAFLRTYRRLVELGSLNPVQAESQQPSFLFARVWRTPAARSLLVLGGLLNLALLTAVMLAIPNHPTVSLGFTPAGGRRDPVPGIQLLFLPVFSWTAYLFNGGIGLFFYRAEPHWAYLLWSAADLVGVLFSLAVWWIL